MGRLINADALKEVICNNVYPVQDAFNSQDYGMFWTGGIEKAIDEAPTIDAEPIRHGKWLTEILEYELEPEKAHYFKCSVCRKWGVVTYNENIQKFKFCAFCGAKMDEDEISNIAKESADKISKALEKVRAKGMQKQNIKEDDEP